MAYCSNCGNKLSDTDMFCESCGNSQKSTISESVVPSIHHPKAKTNILLFKGRISQKDYVKSILVITLISIPGIWAANANIDIVGNSDIGYNLTPTGHIIDLIRANYVVWIAPILLYVFITQSIKRCRDIGRSLWFLLIPIVPLLYLLFEESKPVETKHKLNSSPIKPKDGGGLR